MHDLICEKGSFGANPSAKDLARHLYTRMSCGKVVIVTDKPVILLSALRKQWLKLARKVQKERASTLNATKIFELTNITARMHGLVFTTRWSPEDYVADVYIATLDQVLSWTPDCRTMYLASKVTTEQAHLATAWMPKGSLVVLL